MLTGWIAGRMRITLVAIITVVALGAPAGVWSYTTATVKNEASVTVSEPENALIALDLLDYIEVQQGVTKIPCGTIKNNMPLPLDNLIVSGSHYSVQDSSLGRGDFTSIVLHIPSDEEIGLQTYSGLVMVRWENGSAEIQFDVTARITAPPENSGPSKSDTDTGNAIPNPETPIPLELEVTNTVAETSEVTGNNDSTGGIMDDGAQQDSGNGTEKSSPGGQDHTRELEGGCVDE